MSEQGPLPGPRTKIGKYGIYHAFGLLYVEENENPVIVVPCDDPRDVDHLISLASDACARQAKTYLDAYRDISGKDWAPLGELDHLKRRG